MKGEHTLKTCTFGCVYCPTEEDEDGEQINPKSYLTHEPGVLRAVRNNYSTVGQARKQNTTHALADALNITLDGHRRVGLGSHLLPWQVRDRLSSLLEMGHDCSKVFVRCVGGTWSVVTKSGQRYTTVRPQPPR